MMRLLQPRPVVANVLAPSNALVKVQFLYVFSLYAPALYT